MAAESQRPGLTAVVITRNEEQNLPRFLENVLPWADEVVIIDDGSTDRTPQIAKAAGAKVTFVHHAMSGDGYAGQRNVGIEHASHNWLLHLDCDERVPAPLKREIDRRLQDTDMNAFRYRRQNYFMHRPMHHGGWTSWNRPQLARKGCHKFVGALHEACEVDGGAARIGQLEPPMAHLNEDGFAARLAKSQKYVAMSAKKRLAEGGRIRATSLFTGPAKEFLKRYILQRGFLDGVPGLIAGMHAATSEFRTSALVWDAQNAIQRGTLESAYARHVAPETGPIAEDDSVSVVIPTFNRAHLITDALSSVLKQEVQPIEVVIVDDGSTDATLDVIAAWNTEQAPRFGLTVVEQAHAGGNAARNRGIEAARGAYVAFLDSDDTWYPEKLGKQVNRLKADANLGAVYCGLREVEAETGQVLSVPSHAFPQGDLLSDLLVSDVTGPTSTYMVRRRLLVEAGGFDEDLEARQDWDMWIRIAELSKIGCVRETLVNLRQHGGLRTVSDPTRELRAYHVILAKYAHLRRRHGLRVSLAARASFHRRAGRVALHYQKNRGNASLHYLTSIAIWPVSTDTWLAIGGMLLGKRTRAALREGWNKRFGGTRFAIRSH
ncbi:MAG: glycosyltransferase [Pseudomonadota bacterium]